MIDFIVITYNTMIIIMSSGVDDVVTSIVLLFVEF